jgi:hypothetical protein
MLVDRLVKETTDVARSIVDMSWWLDSGETITSIVSSSVGLGSTGWSEAPYPPPGSPPPYDPTPLLLETVAIDTSNTQLIVFVSFGTPGNVYTCQFVLAGSSNRQVTVEIGVQLAGQPPAPQGSIAIPATGSYALPLAGGTMEGPLYLFEDPLYPTEAATKQYVDDQFETGGMGIPEPPEGGVTYGRAYGSWLPVVPASGGTMLGALEAAAGTLAAPGLTIGSPATGFYTTSPGTQVSLGVGGVQVAMFANNLTYLYTPLNMFGQQVLNLADPTTPTGAATKEYVDNIVGASGGPFLPLAGGTVFGTTAFTGSGTGFSVSHDGTVGGNFSITGNLSVGGTITGAALAFLPLVGGTVTGLTTFSGTGTGLSVIHDATVGGNLAVTGNVTGAGGSFLLLSGGTLTGALTLAGDPTVNAQAATKNYVDTHTTGLFLPLATGGTVAGATTFSATGTGLAVTNNANVGGTLAVTGTSGFNLTTGGAIRAGGSTTPGQLRLDGVSGTTRQVNFTTNNSQRWQMTADPTAEVAGTNAGSLFTLNAYNDTGLYIGQLWQASRASNSIGTGLPYFQNLAPWRQNATRAGTPNAVIGNDQELGTTGDIQPTTTLLANPLSVTSGSPIVTVTWAGACVASGVVQTANETWVNLQGATAVGGITPSGWLKVQSIVDNNTFRVTWTANATSTAVGGGSAVTVQPSFLTVTNRIYSIDKAFQGGFLNQTSELFCVDPYMYQSTGFGARYQHRWSWTVGPNDTSGSNIWSVNGWEWDFSYRGKDFGYQPNIFAGSAANSFVGFWVGPKASLPPWQTGGGVGGNLNTMFSVFNDQWGASAVYDAFSVQPCGLVGAANDPTGHGGVGIDIFGSYHHMPTNPFATTNGTSTVTVSMITGTIGIQVNGNSVWLPNVVTLNGVTFGGASYVIAGVTASGFTITGTGTATSSGAGGGTGQWLAFANLVPYAPYQAWGSFKHGLISTNARFESGGIIETQPGNGILWNDGTGIANITSDASSVGNINIDLNPAGTGSVNSSAPITITSATDPTIYINTAAAWPGMVLNGPVGKSAFIEGQANGLPRWDVNLAVGSSEPGGNVGSDFQIARYADNGTTVLGTPLTITRSTGNVLLTNNLTVQGTITGANTPSVVATTTGSVPLTGVTVETNLAALRIPAGTIGANGVVEVIALWSYPNSANNKTLIVRFGASGATSGGAAGPALIVTTTQTAQTRTIIRNNNAANSQVCFSVTPSTPYGVANQPVATIGANTAADVYVNLNGTLAVGTETLTLVHAYAVVYPHA